MDHLPPTVTDPELLALLGMVLANDPTPQSTGELRLRSFAPGFSWQALVDLAVAHEVWPALVFALNQRGLLPPVPASLSEEARVTHVASRLAAVYRQHLGWQDDLRAQLAAAMAALNREGIVPLLLKGAVHLTLPQTEWHGARAMRDLDILVPRKEAEQANRILSSLGYRAERDPPPLDRHLPELRLPKRAGAMEIHTEALAFPARHAFATEEVWSRAETRSFAGATFQVLPPEWHLLHGLLHHQLADHGHARRLLAVKGLWEFSKVGGEVPPPGWRAIIDHAEQREILDMLASWAIQANRLFGLKVPEALLTSQAGRKHADATFRTAGTAYGLRQAAFTTDRLRFAFAGKTLAIRYGKSGNAGLAALRHLVFLLRQRGKAARRWLAR